MQHLTVSLLVSHYISLTVSRMIQELPFEKVAHKISTFDAQPSSLDMSTLLINVTGLLRVRFLVGQSPDLATEDDIGGRRPRIAVLPGVRAGKGGRIILCVCPSTWC